MISQKIVKKFTRRVRANFRQGMKINLMQRMPELRVGLGMGIVISALEQAKREHRHFGKKQISYLGNELLGVLDALVPPSCTPSNGETSKEDGNA